MNWLLLAAAMRKESVNKRLLLIAQKKIEKMGIKVDNIPFESMNIPMYDGDIEAIGIPQDVKEYAKKITAADAWVICSPEYNFSIPGTLKNFIDWLSRINPYPMKNKPVLLLSASPAKVGGYRGLLATRVPLECCGAFVFPSMFSLPEAYGAFDEKGNLKDKALDDRLHQLVGDFKNHAEKLLR
ncbi:MAG: NAD(P)H-dependent oxidoreductase [Chlamydiales bacterium]|nr:NAD(P)H-dependent oxidoreductase [Chlamydiales bacterium]